MPGINAGKVVVGGLVAGLVANVIDLFSNFVIMRSDMQAMIDRLHLDPALLESVPVAVAWIVVDFLMGLLLVFTYAAMRPRFAPGPGTAIIAGLTLYLAVTFVMFGLSVMGLMTMALFVKSSACALVSVLAASLAGAALYRE